MGVKTLNNQDYVAIKSIAGYYMVTTSTVRRWIEGGKLNAMKLPSGRFRVTTSDLITFSKKYYLPIPKELLG